MLRWITAGGYTPPSGPPPGHHGSTFGSPSNDGYETSTGYTSGHWGPPPGPPPQWGGNANPQGSSWSAPQNPSPYTQKSFEPPCLLSDTPSFLSQLNNWQLDHLLTCHQPNNNIMDQHLRVQTIKPSNLTSNTHRCALQSTTTVNYLSLILNVV